MGLFDNFPYTNFHELNLDWILKILKEIQSTLEQFVAINSLKYADPIQWDITTQYEKNTIVIEPLSGTAYISVQAVPAGVAISNTDYWTPVFDLSYFITRSGQNFANTFEANVTTTATQATPEGGWIIWDSLLYEATTNISIGDLYVPGGNIELRTVEYFFNILKGLIAAEAQTRADEDVRIQLELTDLITSQIGIEAQTRADEDTRIELELTDLVNSQIGIVQGEINDIVSDIGDLANLTTTDKDCVVDAINEINSLISQISELNVINVVNDIGCVDDGSADCAQAINDYLAADTTGRPLLFPYGAYLFNSTVHIINRDVYILGQVFTHDDITLFKLTGVRRKFIFDKIGYTSTDNITSLDGGSSKGCALEIIPEGDICSALDIIGNYILSDIGIKFTGYGTGFIQNINIKVDYFLNRSQCILADLTAGQWINEIIFTGCSFNCYQTTDTAELITLYEPNHSNLMNGWRFMACAFENFNTAFNLEAAKVYLTNCRLSRQEAFNANSSKYVIASNSSTFHIYGNIEFANVDQNFTLDSSVEGIIIGYINNNGIIGTSAKIMYDGSNQFAFINQGALGRAFNYTFTANNESINCGYSFDLSKGIEINVGAYTGCTVTVVYNNNYRPSAYANEGYYTGFRPFVVTVTGSASITLATPNALGGGSTHTLAGGKSYLITRAKTIEL